jgi:uncharacterized protein (DUF58 family)
VSPATRRSGRPRPERLLAPAGGTIFLLSVWEAVAHASGSGWVQGLATLAAGIAVVGLLGPGLAVRKIRVVAVSAPTDTQAGEEFVVSIRANRPCRCIPLRPEGTRVLAGPGADAELVLSPSHRGVLGEVRILVETAAPFGMLWWSVPRVLDLARPVYVAPQAEAGTAGRAGADDADDGTARPESADFGQLRSVREYRAGDSPRQVHWRASAHTGSLMVRESEAPTTASVAVRAVLSDDLEVAEREASHAFGTVKELLRGGHRVLLETNEGATITKAVVADEQAAGRRLARAGVNPWAP